MTRRRLLPRSITALVAVAAVVGCLVAAVTVLERADPAPPAGWTMIIIGLSFALFAGAVSGVIIAAIGILFAVLASVSRHHSVGLQALAAAAGVLFSGMCVVLLLTELQALQLWTVGWWVACASTIGGSALIALWVLGRVEA